MEKERQVKLLSIVALVLAISAMTLGFAAFSTTLNISSSATVNPSIEDFNIKIYGVTDTGIYTNPPVPYVFDSSILSDTQSLCYSDSASATCETALINNNTNTISNLKATFTDDGTEVIYVFTIKNEGKYDAYLDLSKYTTTTEEGGLVLREYQYGTCTPGTDTTVELVENACKSINQRIMVLSKTTYNSLEITDDYYMIPVGETMLLGIAINYPNDGNLSDGPFTITFPDYKFNFSTTK